MSNGDRKERPGSERIRQRVDKMRQDYGEGNGNVDPDMSPDVRLDVPTVNVDRIALEVDDLEAHVSLHTEVADFVKLDVGADVSINSVKLLIEGVEAQAFLIVRLPEVRRILDTALVTLGENPEIFQYLGETVEKAGSGVEKAGGGLKETTQGLGDTVEQTTQGLSGTLQKALGDGGLGNKISQLQGAAKKAVQRNPVSKIAQRLRD